MYMIEITEDKFDKMSEHVECSLKHLGKLMQCLEDLGEEYYGGAYGEKGRLGMREDDDWYDDEDQKYKSKSKGRFGQRRMR